MKRVVSDGRMFAPELLATAERTDAGIVVRSPGVGLLRGTPAPGSLVGPGSEIGQLEVLGVLHRLVAPAEAAGVVLERNAPRLARRPVGHGDALFVLDPETSVTAVREADDVSADTGTALAFRSPLSGRYYARPAPDRPPFVRAGDEIVRGQTIALLEVMKTFNRITYGGEGLPERARVVAMRATDEDDLDEGDVIFDLEPV